MFEIEEKLQLVVSSNVLFYQTDAWLPISSDFVAWKRAELFIVGGTCVRVLLLSLSVDMCDTFRKLTVTIPTCTYVSTCSLQ